MEIRISAESLTRAIWMLSIALGTVGFLVLLLGIFLAVTAGNSGESIVAATTTLLGVALAFIPHLIADSVTRLAQLMGNNSEAEANDDATPVA